MYVVISFVSVCVCVFFYTFKLLEAQQQTENKNTYFLIKINSTRKKRTYKK